MFGAMKAGGSLAKRGLRDGLLRVCPMDGLGNSGIVCVDDYI